MILIRAFPDCGQPKTQAMTAIVLHILKGLAGDHAGETSRCRTCRAELRDLLCLYLGSCAGS